MYKKILMLFLIVLIACNSLFSQKAGNISGRIIDKQSDEAIPFATVVLLKDKQSTSVGTVTDDKGYFYMDALTPAEYGVIVSFIGYNTDTLDNIVISNAKRAYDLGDIPISVSNISLDEVEVSAMSKTVTTKIDRKTYRASDFETAKGGTATDVLNKLPSVSVSPDGEVSVRGTTDFMVYLNGKPTQMEPSMLLAQISSDAIEHIDIITVPSAKYDAQGKGGIINITTKTNGVDGLAVSANGVYGAAPWGHKTDKYSGYSMNDNRYGGGVNLRYGKDKLTLLGGVNYNYKNVNGKRTGDARILDTTDNAYKHMVASGERPEWYEYYSANAGVEYKFTAASHLSASYFYGNRTEGRSAFYIYNNFYADKDKKPIQGIPSSEEWIYNPNIDNRYGVFHTFNIDYRYKFDEKSELSTSLLYEHSKLNRVLDNYNYAYTPATDETGEILLHFNQADNTPLDAYRFSLDYAKEFDNGNTIGIGFQPQYFSINGSFSYDTLGVASNVINNYAALENAIDLTRGVYAGYIDYSGAIGKVNYIIGLRLEYTDQEMEITNPDYFTIFDRATQTTYTLNQLDWFPTVHASYNINQTNKLSLAASRRISRPPIKNMAPFLYRRHLEVYVVGDPGLKPEYINNLELGWDKTIGKQKINLLGFYRGVDNAIFRVNTVYTDEMVLIRSYTNSGNSMSLGAELNANIEAAKFLKLFLGGSLYNYRVQGEVFGYKEDNGSTNWSLKGNANFIINKQLKFTADFDVKSATVTAQGKNDLFYMANTALSYTPAKVKNLNVSARVLDILSSNITGLNTRAFNEQGEQIFYQETVYFRTGPIAEISLSYTFNNGRQSTKARKTMGDSEF